MTEHPTDNPVRQRPEGVDDATVEALGKVSEAMEAMEVARGHLYTFHRLMGTADLALGQGVDLLREAGHDAVADRLETEVVGRNVLDGRWTFQVVEEFDDGYYAAFKAAEQHARDELSQGVRHLYEAEMKQDRRSAGRAGHEPRPPQR